MHSPFRHRDTADGDPGSAPTEADTAGDVGSRAPAAPPSPEGGNEPVVDFYWRPGCPFCMMLKRSVNKRGLPVEYHNIWEDPGAAAIVRDAAGGNETVPTIGIAGHMLVNPRADLVEELLAKVADGTLAPRN